VRIASARGYGLSRAGQGRAELDSTAGTGLLDIGARHSGNQDTMANS
jgi:hypothetical protein